MRYTYILLPMLILSFFAAAAQKKTHTVDELKKLGRDSLIKMAIAKLDDSTFQAQYYDRVTVKANKTSVEVEFELSVRFKNGKKCFYDAVTVGILNGTTGKGASGDCDKISYYKPTSSMTKKIAFVFDAINKSDEIGHLPGNKIPNDATMTIEENLTCYYIEFSDYSTFSHYKIDKITGKIFDAGHKHYARSGHEKSEWEIIK